MENTIGEGFKYIVFGMSSATKRKQLSSAVFGALHLIFLQSTFISLSGATRRAAPLTMPPSIRSSSAPSNASGARGAGALVAAAPSNSQHAAASSALAQTPPLGTTAAAQGSSTEGAGPAVVTLRAPEPIEHRRKKRKSFIDRSAIEWTCITITSAGDTATPVGQCSFCGKTASWTAARIKDHILGMNGSRPCGSDSSGFLELKEKVAEKRIVATGKKDRKAANEEMDRRTEENIVFVRPSPGQTSIKQSVQTLQARHVDEAVARFVYGDNLSFCIVESPRFSSLISVLRHAPESYKLPDRHRLSGDLLDTVTSQLVSANESIKNNVLSQPAWVQHPVRWLG